MISSLPADTCWMEELKLACRKQLEAFGFNSVWGRYTAKSNLYFLLKRWLFTHLYPKLAAEEGETGGFLSCLVGPLNLSSLWDIVAVGYAGASLALSLNVSTGHHWVWLAFLSFGTITAQITLASWIILNLSPVCHLSPGFAMRALWQASSQLPLLLCCGHWGTLGLLRPYGSIRRGRQVYLDALHLP